MAYFVLLCTRGCGRVSGVKEWPAACGDVLHKGGRAAGQKATAYGEGRMRQEDKEKEKERETER